MPNAKGKKRAVFPRISPLILVVLVTLAVRVMVLWWRNGNDPFFKQPINDAAVYMDWARSLIAGSPFGLPGSPFHLAPLYPRFLSWVLPLGGGSIWAVMVIQALMGSLTVLGTGLLARRIAGARAGWLAALLLSLCAPLIWYEGWLLPTTLNLLLLVTGLNLLVACSEPRRWNGLLPPLTGLLLGLAAVNRPQHLLLLAGGLGWLFWLVRRESASGRWMKRWQPVFLLGLGATLAIAPVTLRNLVVSGEPVLITANGGLNFYLGNNTEAHGRFGLPEGFTPYVQDQQKVSRELASSQAGSDLNWQGVTRHWLGRTLADIRNAPGKALSLAGRKLRLTLAWREMENNFVAKWVHNHLGPARILFPSLGFLWILAVPGMILAVRDRRPSHGPLWILMVTTLLTCLLFWVSTRNRLPLVIPLSVFSAMALARPESWRKRIPIIAVTAIVVIVLWPTGEPREGAGFYVDLGRIQAQSGDYLTARENFNLALEIDPATPMALNGLALTYMDEGNRKQAVAILKSLLASYPDFEFARRNLEAIQRSAPTRGTPRSR
ncbi:MAG: tetratricopeptide repeat protein [Gemmatimonadales bacterium]|nr:tetratricopeptide repeat protein [Gemmatimonadales bacterium]